MIDHPHAKLARSAWEAVSHGDSDTLARCCTEDMVWHASGRGLRSGRYRGLAETMDYLAATIDKPLVIAVVDFDGGGRMLCMMTDRELAEVEIGMPVEMSFRKLRVVNGIHNYYWKAVPLRAGVPSAV